ncbi:MAG: TetR/AcrR family transcriptional regulator [Gordonia sp. (in: high G+C Gram-positive bacteria)]|jgi:AcrR family transcriptional regulator|nr:TetR/AcrR family transcriptional regulator [Gordonia sp. (in: high G+C Gram-positive bacteria)]
MSASPQNPDIPRITEGAFFTTPRRLPRGPHGLTRDEVQTIQRERLMIAYTELVAAHGYHAVGVRDVVARSSMSRTAFYECFDNLDACADAAYQRFITVLVSTMTERLRATDVSHEVPTVILSYLEALQFDLVVARTFQLEFDAAGPASRRRRRDALGFIATVLRDEHRRLAKLDPSLDPDLPTSVFLAMVYALRQLASDALDDADVTDLRHLEAPLSAWLTRSLRRS